jgi:Cys-tRNA(Pro)/Cys-tRNA(Cys) deacylase
MTPAVRLARSAAVDFKLHEYRHDPAAGSYGLEAAEALGVDPDRVYKTLVASLSKGGSPLVVAVIPVTTQLDLKALAAATGAKRAELADARKAERATGYVVGGISPLAQKTKLPLVLDARAPGLQTLFVSAGRRGLEIELRPADLLALSGGRVAAVAR